MRAGLTAQYARLQDYLTSDLLSFADIRRIVLPILWEQTFLAVFSIVSLWLMSFDGENAVSVVNMMSVVNHVFVSVCLGFVSGGTVLVAQNIGAGQPERAAYSLTQTVALTVLLTGTLALLLVWGRGPLVGFLLAGADAAIVSQAVLYFTAFCVSYPCYAFYQSFAGCMRGWGRTRVAWSLTLTVNLLELALTALLVLGQRRGVAGIALAMVLARAAGALLALCLLLRDRRALGLRPLAHLRPDAAILRGLLCIAAPLALEQFFFNSGKAVSQRFIAGCGTSHMAANGVVNAVFGLVNIPQVTLQVAVVTVVGMCVGGGRSDLARRYVYRFIRIIRHAMLRLMPLTLPLAALLTLAYRLSFEGLVLSAVCLGLIFFFGPLFLGGSFTVPAGLRAGGDAAFVSAVVLSSVWLVRVCLTFLFTQVFSMGVIGLNCAMVIEWMVRNQAFRARLKGTAWCSRRLIRVGEA